MKKFKILHIWDICNNSAYITEKIIPMGHKSLVITRKNYSRKTLIGYYLRVIYRLITFKADIVHVNAWTKGIKFAKIFSRKSKILMHFHGSDIRGKEIPENVLKKADLICFSTLDIFYEHAVGEDKLLPVIVRDYFYDSGLYGLRNKKKALYIHHYQDNMLKAQAYAADNNLDLVIFNRMDPEVKLILHVLMPHFLSSFEYYLDFKGYTNKHTLTLTAREAIACGCKVVVDNLDIVTDFPITTIDDYLKVYENLVK